MINYKLAKQLKDAGFPQNTRNYFYLIDGIVVDEVYTEMEAKLDTNMANWEKSFACPTLSELIDACGDEFDHLGRGPMGRWNALAADDTGLDISAKTSEEAVAKLYLKLNK